jgi:SAM-dependent methyltransferase
MNRLYQEDFALFCRLTNEKEVLQHYLAYIVRTTQTQSILDIGAGNGDLAIPLSQLVAYYMAIEKQPEYVQRLRQADIPVLEADFPVEIKGFYDLVLLSHVISHSPASWGTIVDAAWTNVAQNGELIIITHRGKEDHWTRLLRRIGQDHLEQYRTGFEALCVVLEGLGRLSIHVTTSLVRTKNLDELLEALSFVASNGISERKQAFLDLRIKLAEIFHNEYFSNGYYCFPFDHYILRTRKTHG